jgi:uncharacterized HAD superfamily protein
MLIAIDIDEVLADTLNHFIFLYNQKFKTSFKRDDFYTFNWWEVLGLTKEEFKKVFTQIVGQGFFSELATIAGAKEGVKRLQKKHELAVVTSRPRIVSAATKAWLDKHFPDVFSKVYFTREVILGPNIKDKDEICQEIGADLIIEDEFEFAEDCAQENILVLLFDNPWNREFKIPSYMTRVYSWENILNKINT